MWCSAARDRRARAVHGARALPVLLDVEAALAGRRPSWAFIPEAAGHDIDRKAHVKYLDRGESHTSA